jgi:hypothetical protein
VRFPDGFPYRDRGVDRRVAIKWVVAVSVIVLVVVLGGWLLIGLVGGSDSCGPYSCPPATASTTQPRPG